MAVRIVLPSAARVALVAAAALIAASAVTGCRGTTSPLPPVHLNPNMDQNQAYTAQEHSEYFADGRAMRPPVPGTVARASVAPAEDDLHLRADTTLYLGRGRMGAAGVPCEHTTDRGTCRLIAELPAQIPLTRELLARGEERYGIFCVPCHGAAGDGVGIVAQRGLSVAPTPYHSDALRAMPLGHFFDAITRGVRTMEPYAAQIPVTDRWAIAAWVRTLQVAHAAKLADVPADVVEQQGWGTP